MHMLKPPLYLPEPLNKNQRSRKGQLPILNLIALRKVSPLALALHEEIVLEN